MRLEIAYLLAALLVVGGGLIIWLTQRYTRYRSRQMRGHHDKPVWKPFWMQ